MDGSVKLTFPDTEYVSVTFPGVVRDKKTFERMIPHVALAGQQNASELALKLHLRPEDPNQIPIKGYLRVALRTISSLIRSSSHSAVNWHHLERYWSRLYAGCERARERNFRRRLKLWAR